MRGLKKVLVVEPKEDATVLACKKSFCTTKVLSPTKLLEVTEPLIPDPDVFGAVSYIVAKVYWLGTDVICLKLAEFPVEEFAEVFG